MTENPADFIPGDNERTTEDRIAEVESEGSTPYVRDERPLHSGSERSGDDEGPVDPAQFVGSGAPVVEKPWGRGRSAPGDFVHSPAISNLHHRAQDARRREASHLIGTPKKVAAQWQKVLTACDEADRLVREVPLAMGAASAARSRALAEATEAVVLPDASDARAFAEQQAIKACHAAIRERTTYDALVVECGPEWTQTLADEVPKAAAQILKRAEGLEADLKALREATSAYVQKAGRSPGRVPASMPGQVRLDGLEAITKEARALADVAAAPSVPDIQPSMREREQIWQRGMHAMGPTAEIVMLARAEASEGYKHSRFTKGVYPEHVLRNAEGSWIS